MKRKKICIRCGKIILENSKCCTKDTYKNRRKSEENKKADKLLNCKKWRDVRSMVLNRDKHTCQRCLIKYNIINNENLEVHHIKSRLEYPHLVYNLDNLITTCKICNLQLEAKELNHKLDFEWIPPEEEFNL